MGIALVLPEEVEASVFTVPKPPVAVAIESLRQSLEDKKRQAERLRGQLLDAKLELKSSQQKVEELVQRIQQLEKYKLELTKPSEEPLRDAGWKGKDEPTIARYGDVWVRTTHQKIDKKTGEIKEVKKAIPHINVVELYNILINLTALERQTSPLKYQKEPVVLEPRAVWAKLIEYHNITDLEIDAFNGGRNRAKYYFPLYYNPMKILEHLEKVEYSASGDVIVNSELLFIEKRGAAGKT